MQHAMSSMCKNKVMKSDNFNWKITQPVNCGSEENKQGRVYFPEVFREIAANFPEDFREIVAYFPEEGRGVKIKGGLAGGWGLQ